MGRARFLEREERAPSGPPLHHPPSTSLVVAPAHASLTTPRVVSVGRWKPLSRHLSPRDGGARCCCHWRRAAPPPTPSARAQRPSSRARRGTSLTSLARSLARPHTHFLSEEFEPKIAQAGSSHLAALCSSRSTRRRILPAACGRGGDGHMMMMTFPHRRWRDDDATRWAGRSNQTARGATTRRHPLGGPQHPTAHVVCHTRRLGDLVDEAHAGQLLVLGEPRSHVRVERVRLERGALVRALAHNVRVRTLVALGARVLLGDHADVRDGLVCARKQTRTDCPPLAHCCGVP